MGITQVRERKESKLKKNKIILSIIVIVLVGVISVGTIHQQKVKAERMKQEAKTEVKNTVQESQEDPYKNLSKANAENIAKLDKAVSKIITEKLNTKPLDGLKEAEEALKVLDIKEADLTSIHEAYAGIISVVKEPDVDTLQDTRTAMANMNDTEFSDYMINEYEDKLIEIVGRYKLIDLDQVKDRSKPLSPQQMKAKQAAKAKAEKEAADKAAADKKADEQAQRDNEAARKAEADRIAEAERQAANQAQNEANNQNQNDGYVPPVDNGYTPPVDNGYTPPANNGGASNNGAAQDAANNTPTPQPPANNNDISGTDAPNGGVMEPGGW